MHIYVFKHIYSSETFSFQILLHSFRFSHGIFASFITFLMTKNSCTYQLLEHNFGKISIQIFYAFKVGLFPFLFGKVLHVF
jgi:hypothetical protein